MNVRRIANIERLRALAALGVVLCHVIGQFYGATRFSPGPERLIGWAGQVGVAVFFVVSGFCIRLPMARARASDPAARLDVRRYLQRRAQRILPPYWIAIAASIVVGLISPIGLLDGGHGLLNVGLHLLGLHTLWPGSISSINGVFWTIGLEIQFYLAYLLLANRAATPAKGMALLVIAVAAYGAASLALPDLGGWRQVGQAFILVTLWQWYIGAVLADLYVRHARAFAAAPRALVWTVRIGAFVALFALGLGDPVVARVHIAYWALPFAALAAVAGALIGRQPVRQIPLDALGQASYSLYLLHPAALGLVVLAAREDGWPPWLSAGAAILGACAAALLSYRLVERPFLARPKPLALAAAPAE
ncbi:MAG TPA: acyltransferase [Caulobacteraceae bacterium]|jgi:peptidoglycan/LPS O-acetylase OafA/YrhL